MPEKPYVWLAELEAVNYGRIRHAHVYLPGEGGIVPITGKNGAGKTTLKEVVAALVGGDGGVIEEPRNRDAGDDEPTYLMGKTTDGTTIRRTITGAKSAPKGRLTAVDAEGRALKQSHLSAIVGPQALAPMRFHGLSEADKREVLLGFAPGLREEIDRLNETALRISEERKPHNSRVQVLTRLALPKGERPQPVDVSAELRRMGELQRVERERQDLLRLYERAQEGAAAEMRRRVLEATRELGDVRQAVRSNAGNQKHVATEIRELELALVSARARQDVLAREALELQADLERAEAALAEVPEPDEAAAGVPEPQLPPDPSEEMDAVRARIDAADRIREALEPWRTWDQAQRELQEHREAAEKLTAKLRQIEQGKREALAKVDLPFTGLGVADDGRILLDGLPLGSASGAQIARLTLEVAVAHDPTLRAILMSGVELDPDTLAVVDAWAREKRVHVLMDMWYSPGLPSEVRMVDGVSAQEGVAVMDTEPVAKAPAVPADCPTCAEPGMKPSHNGSKSCESGSIASGGPNAHCSCGVCF